MSGLPVQLFPTSVRASGLGLCATMSRLGAVLAPFLTVDLAAAGHARLAELMIAACCLVAAVLVLMLPETAKQQLQVGAAARATAHACSPNGMNAMQPSG